MSQATAIPYPLKTSVADLGLFGGAPLFDRPRSIGQLYTPDFEAFRPMLQDMLHTGRLIDHGPYALALEQRLAAMHGVAHCVGLANAALGLMMLMQIFGGDRGGEILMPGFSYRGLPHFARWAGLEPAFCDVDPDTHVLCPKDLERRITPHTRAILVVATCYSAGPMDEYVVIGARYGLPVFFDSVYGIGMTYGGAPLGGHGDAEVFSLHATKLLNGFEGGYVTTNDDALAERLRRLRDGADDGAAWGLEAQLNEAHAAMALLSLDGVDGIIERNRLRYDAYQAALAAAPGLSLVPYGSDENYNYELVIADVGTDWPLTRDQMLALLRAENAAVSVYYAPPLHRAWKLALAPPPHLPVADALAERFLQLPVGEGVSIADIEAMGRLFALIRREGAELARRMGEATA